MSRTFVYFQKPDVEVIINPDNIKYMHKRGEDLFIAFLGDEEPLHLQGEQANSFWWFMRDGSKTYPPPEQEYDPMEM